MIEVRSCQAYNDSRMDRRNLESKHLRRTVVSEDVVVFWPFVECWPVSHQRRIFAFVGILEI